MGDLLLQHVSRDSRTGRDDFEKCLTIDVVVLVSNSEVEGFHRVPGYGI